MAFFLSNFLETLVKTRGLPAKAAFSQYLRKRSLQTQVLISAGSFTQRRGMQFCLCCFLQRIGCDKHWNNGSQNIFIVGNVYNMQENLSRCVFFYSYLPIAQFRKLHDSEFNFFQSPI